MREILFFIVAIVVMANVVSCSEDEYKLPDVEPILLNGTWYRSGDVSTSNDDFGMLLIIKAYLKLEQNSFNFSDDNTYVGVDSYGDEVTGVWRLEDNSVLYLNEGSEQEIIYTINKADEIEMEWELYYSGDKLGTSKDAFVFIKMHKEEHDYTSENE